MLGCADLAAAQTVPQPAASQPIDAAPSAAQNGAPAASGQTAASPSPQDATVELGASSAAGVGSAQGIGDIVVTAQRRSESLQKVPLAITAVTSAELARSGIRDLSGIAAVVPNLNLGQQLGVAKISLRGIGLENISAGAEGSIAFHVDGVFQSRSITALSSFYDVEQVEVLRGPQGTLYGRNATGGSINITTREPTDAFTGYADATVGNYGRYTTDGAVSGAIVPGVLLARLAFQTDNHDGYGKNVVTRRDIDDLNTRSVRGKLLFKPTDRLSFELTGDYHRQQDRSGGYHYLGSGGFSAPGVPITPTGFLFGGQVASNPRDISNESDPSNHVRFWGVSGKLAYDLGGGTEFRSLTAYRRTNYTTRSDLDSTSALLAPLTQSEHDKQFSEELQLTGKTDRLSWIVGLFYFHENDAGLISVPFSTQLFGFPPPYTVVQGYYGGGYIKTDALAGYGQASYEIVDKLRLTLGARYSSEKKTDHDVFAFDLADPVGPGEPQGAVRLDRSKRFKSFTPRVALDYQVDPNVLLYASWSRGFKSGTYNLAALQAPVSPEKVSAFEAGLKSTILDRRLRFNLAGFYYKYKDLQVGKVVGQSLLLENAADATIYGFEAELQAKLSSRFDVNANGSWLHARFDKYVSADPARPYGDGQTTDGGVPAFNLAGNTLSQSPNFTFFVGSEYHLPTEVGTFTLRGEVAWKDRSFFTPFNRKYVAQGANTKVNAFLNWVSASDRLSGSVFVKNLTNKTTISNTFVSSALVGFAVNGYLDEPRTYGATVGIKF